MSIIQEHSGNPNEEMLDEFLDDNICRAMVFAMPGLNMNAGMPTIFRTYHVATNQGPKCHIWEALCASMADPYFFKCVNIGESATMQSYVGGGLGCNNPIVHVLREVKTLCPHAYIASILSLGAGRTQTIQISSSGWQRRFASERISKATKNLAYDSERVAHEMDIRFHNTNIYFRFNVEQGMQETRPDKQNRQHEVAAHTAAYMKQNEVNRRMDIAAETVHRKERRISAVYIDGNIQGPSNPTALKFCPLPSPVFTGRKKHIDQVEKCLITSAQERRVCVIHGLGGVGKSQLALKVIALARKKWRYILHVDASSRASIESALQEFALVGSIGKTFKDTIRWLESYPGENVWLLVFDNADDPSVDLHTFFPSCDHGSILITTRLPDLEILRQGQETPCKLPGMEKEDALELLLRTARILDDSLPDCEREAATKLLEDFGFLPLAIVQAGAYIGHSHHMTISQYRELFLARRQNIFNEYTKLPCKMDNYSKTVHTTWKFCYELLGQKAQSLLWLIAFLHFDLIMEEIFRRAAIRMQSYQYDIAPTETEVAARVLVQNTLGGFLDRNGCWDTIAFSEAINEISSCSLLEYSQANRAYSIHVLVQDWIRTVIPHSPDLAIECPTMLLFLSIDLHNTIESRAFRRSIGPHIIKILLERQDPIGADCGANFSHVCTERGLWHDAETLESQVKEARELILGREHPRTLASANRLAQIYLNQGQYDPAIRLHTEVLDARRQLLGEEHPETLESMDQLAATLRSQGLWNQAENMHTKVLAARKCVLGKTHPDTLVSMSNLAYIYVDQGKWSQAEELHSLVLDTRKQILGEEHPDALASMNHLALTYRRQGRWDLATKLYIQVLDARTRMLGKEHPHTLTTMNNLAASYVHQGQWEKAEQLQRQVLDARTRLLGANHPDTLTSVNNLGYTHLSQSQWDKAEMLHKKALQVQEQRLGQSHPDTLLSLNNLALVHLGQGRYKEAEKLHTHVYNERKQQFGIEHPDTLMSMNNLGVTYTHQGRLDEAEKLHMDALSGRRRLFGEEHPNTLTSMHNLATTYQNQGQWEKSEELEAKVVDARKRILGEKHPDTLASMRSLALIYQSHSEYGRATSLLEQQHPVSDTSQFATKLDLLEPFLNDSGIGYPRLDGSMVPRVHKVALENIRNSSKTKLIPRSFKAGSTGLNLTACSSVILVDVWWNPALEDQVFDRAHRLGQTKDVNIYKLTIPETVEERILKLQDTKRDLAKAALSGDKLSNNRLRLDDIMNLFNKRSREESDDEDED